MRLPRSLRGLIAASAVVFAACDTSTNESLPAGAPLIDREVFFGDPDIAGAALSPDGRWISFRKQHRGVMNIWVKGIEEPFAAARPITAETQRPVSAYFWTEDSSNVLYVQDQGGDENYHIYAVDPSANVDKTSGVPPARDLTPLPGIRAAIYAVPESTPRQIIVGLNDRDPAHHDVYRLDIDTAERRLLINNDANIATWVADRDGVVRLAVRQRDDGGSEILIVENGQLGRVLYGCDFGDQCDPVRFHKDGRRVYVVSNRGADVDLTRLVLVDVATGSETLVEQDPLAEVDFGGALFSDATEALVGTYYLADRMRIYPREDGLQKDLAWLRKQLPDGDYRFRSTEDDTKWIVFVNADVDPGSAYLVDRPSRRVERLYQSRPDLPGEHLAAMTALRYPARDGESIPAYLMLPKGGPAKGLPAVILPHGGPWAREVWRYNATAQFLANRGYAVLLPNFRSSTGYGKRFMNAGDRNWGTGVMQHDLSDGVKYLVERGIADPDRVAIMGGSYGGYATLAGLTFTPDLYAAGVSIVGPSNIITLLSSIPPYWGPLRRTFDLRVGDPSEPADLARLRAQSPVFHASAIRAPLLVIQGANDPRVKQAESDQIVAAVRALNRPVAYIVAPDEGHGFRRRENRLAMFTAIETFLATHLGGRRQERVSAEVAARLAVLTVDVDQVEL